MRLQPPAAGKIDWNIINALRGLAALYVVINHSRGQLFTDAMVYAEKVNPKETWHWWEWLQILVMQHTNLGQEFVILFFVLSGFSIAHSLSLNPPVGGFYLRRAIRLYPTYILGIIWAIIVFLIIAYVAPDIYYNAVDTDKPIAVYFKEFIALPTMVQNLLYHPVNNFLTIQYWSLPLEVVFYLVAPWFIKHTKWFGIATIAFYLLGWILNGHTSYDVRYAPLPLMYIFDYSIYFLAGIVIYRYRDYLLQHFRIPKWLVAALLLLLFEVMVVLKSYIYHQEHNKILGLIMIAFSYIILVGALHHKVHVRWLENIGKYSYTLYISHLATIHIVNAVAYYFGYGFYTISNLFVWYIGIALSILCAYLLYWVAEYPSTRYLERLRNKR